MGKSDQSNWIETIRVPQGLHLSRPLPSPIPTKLGFRKLYGYYSLSLIGACHPISPIKAKKGGEEKKNIIIIISSLAW